MSVIITAPSLDPNLNVSGVSSVAKFIIDNNKDYKYFHLELGKRDNETRGLGWGLRILKALITLFIQLLTGKANIVHFNYALSKPSIIRDTPFIFVTRLFNVKLIIHLHGGEFLMKENPPQWIKRYLEYVLNGNESKIVLSELEKQVVEAKFKAKNVFVLPNCVDLGEAQSFQRVINNTSPLKVLFMGRITISKGIEQIVDAFKLLKNEGIAVEFSCAGKGPEADIFIGEMTKILGDKFIYNGVVKGAGKIDLLKKCDVFILPSLFGEGLPMALLEAMSFGLVPIVTDDGSMKFTVEDKKSGFVVAKESPEEIMQAIKSLANDRSQLGNMSQEAQKNIFTNYNPEVYIQKLDQLYEGK